MGGQKLEGEVDVGEGQDGKFVVVDEWFELELEDLLRASAYVVGKSRSGIVYKVVGVGRGSSAAANVVAVRRLSEGDATWRFKEFESEVEAIARVRHPNVVPLRAYYYAHDEKLLITDFIRNGSLHTALHGINSLSLFFKFIRGALTLQLMIIYDVIVDALLWKSRVILQRFLLFLKWN